MPTKSGQRLKAALKAPVADEQQPPLERPRVVVADDAATRLGVRIALQGLVDICAEVGDTAHAIRAAKQYQPQICVIGQGIDGDGLAAVRGVCRAAPDAKVVFIGHQNDADGMLDAVRCGAIGYIPSNVDVDALRRIIKAVVADEAILPRAMIRDVLLELRMGADESADLTRREVQILGMLRRGHSTASIAGRLEIETVTVRRHVSSIVRKLGVENRAMLIDEPAS
jgi:DNA-binding NarL/FixJ family response regulator